MRHPSWRSTGIKHGWQAVRMASQLVEAQFLIKMVQFNKMEQQPVHMFITYTWNNPK
jgi:hypothetical protein